MSDEARSSSLCGAVRWGVSSGGQLQLQRSQHETLSPQQLREWYARRSGGGGSSGRRCAAVQSGVCGGGLVQLQRRPRETLTPQELRECDTWRAEFGDAAELPRWLELLRCGVAIIDLDYDAILSAMHALSASAEGDCYRCVSPDPGLEAAALGASKSSLPGTAPTEAFHTFTLDSGASRCFFRDITTLTPLSAPVPVRLADPSGGPVLAHSSIDAMVTTTTFGGQRVLICTCIRTGRHLATFTRWPGSSLYTLATEPPQVAASAQVSASGPVAPLARVASWRTRLSCGTTALVTPPCHAFVACTPASLSLVFPSLCLPSHPRLPCRAFLASRGGRAPFLTPPRIPRRLLPCRLSTWTFCLQLRERFRQDLPVLRLHSDKGGEFPSNFLREFCHGEGILQSFMLPASPQQNGIAERRIGLVMEVARTSMIHVAAPHFLWPFAVQYIAHQLNLWPRVSLLETLPTLRSTGEVGDASVFWDVTFDVSVPFYRLFPYRSAPPPPPPLFLAPVPPPLDPLPPEGLAPSGVSQVDPLPGTVLVEVAVGSGATRGAASRGAEPGGAESEGAGLGVEPGGAEPEGVEPGGAESEGAESGGAEPRGIASSRGPTGASPRLSPRPEPFYLLQLREWFARRTCLRSGAAGVGDSSAGGAGVIAGAGGTGDPTEPRAAGAGGARVGGTSAGGAVAVGAGAGGAGAVDHGAGGAGAGGTVSCGTGAGGTGRPRPYFVPLLQQPASPLPPPSPYTEQTGGLTERREPASRLASPVRTGRRVPRPLPPPVPGTHAMALQPSFVPRRIPVPPPPESSFPAVPDRVSDRARAASPTVSRLLATVVTDPSFESTAASALVVELVDFADACRLDYATALVAESESAM
ncbi:unnamed protein product [Closterium sp. NIES-54]